MLSLRQAPKFSLRYHNPSSIWEQIESISGIIRFDSETYGYLSKVLGRYTSSDPYLTCPAYHALTGRRGLWGYAKGKSFLLFALHPNKEEEIIFFPQFGNPFPNLALEIMDKIESNFSFVRYPEDQVEFMAASMNRISSRFVFIPKTEDVLDWTYPVHTISTWLVSEAKGKNFKGFRCDLNEINPKRVSVEPINGRHDIASLRDIVQSWSKHNHKQDDILTDDCYYTFLLNHYTHPALNLSGVKFFWDQELVAFEIWSVPNKNGALANSLAGLNAEFLHELEGFSSYQHHVISKILSGQGIEYVCLGGSETAGLDHFKRKMFPIKSVRLKSIITNA